MRSRAMSASDRRAAERTDVDERHVDTPGGEQIADEAGLAALGIERGEEEDGRHAAGSLSPVSNSNWADRWRPVD